MALSRFQSEAAAMRDEMVTTRAQAAVFLDRDGVIAIPEFRHGRSYAVTRVEDFRIYPDAKAALTRLKQAGYVLVVVTNQPDVGRGFIAASDLEAMHRTLEDALPIDRIEVCPHTADDGCDCRKPKPGMLFRAAEALGIALDQSVMVGDRLGDVEAGRAAGCRTVFVDLDYTSEPKPTNADCMVASIADAADCILKKPGRSE